MLKRRGRHVCRRICAKSVRLILERYSQYLISRGYAPRCYTHLLTAIGELGDLGDNEESVNGRREAKPVKDEIPCLPHGSWMK